MILFLIVHMLEIRSLNFQFQKQKSSLLFCSKQLKLSVIKMVLLLNIKLPYNIAINHRAFGTGLKTATRFFAGYGRR